LNSAERTRQTSQEGAAYYYIELSGKELDKPRKKARLTTTLNHPMLAAHKNLDPVISQYQYAHVNTGCGIPSDITATSHSTDLRVNITEYFDRYKGPGKVGSRCFLCNGSRSRPVVVACQVLRGYRETLWQE
jgi:hypothetical protein